MVLKEIFKNSPELIEHNEVKALLQYVSDRHKEIVLIYRRDQRKLDLIMEACMYSEAFLVEGEDAKSTLEKILNIL